MGAAQDKLDAAVQEFLETTDDWGPKGGVLTDYVILTAESLLGEDGDRTVYGRIYKGNYQPYHVTLGLIDVAMANIKREMLDQ